MAFAGINSKAVRLAHRYEENVKAPADELVPKFGEYKTFQPCRDVRIGKLDRGTDQ